MYSEADSRVSDLQKAHSENEMSHIDAAFDVLMSSPSQRSSTVKSNTKTSSSQRQENYADGSYTNSDTVSMDTKGTSAASSKQQRKFLQAGISIILTYKENSE